MGQTDCRSCLEFRRCQKDLKDSLTLCCFYRTKCPGCKGKVLRFVSKEYEPSTRLTRATMVCDKCGDVYEINTVRKDEGEDTR